MSTTPTSALVDVIERNEETLLRGWVREQESTSARRGGPIGSAELEAEAREFLALVRETLRTSGGDDVAGESWSKVHARLARLSRSRAEAGFSPSETAIFVFSLKQPLFSIVGDELAGDPEALRRGLWEATVLLDTLGLMTM